MNVGPAELPLPGGQPQATMVLHPLCCAEVAMTEGWVNAEPGLSGALGVLGIAGRTRRALRAPIVAFLLEHPSAGVILVDTGFHADVITDKRRALGPLSAMAFRGVRMRAEQTIASQLTARGIAPADVALIVMTHLHVDHAGALRDFPDATVLVSEAEWHAARARLHPLAGYHAAQLDPRLTYRLVHHPARPAAGTDRLTEALDVFGDGSLRLLSTPGHTAGHQSVVVRLRDREALLAGDAIYTMGALREGHRPWHAADPEAYRQSVEALVAYDRTHPDALIVPGHDMAFWSTLSESYR